MPNVGGSSPTHRSSSQTFSAAWAYGRARLAVDMGHSEARVSTVTCDTDNKAVA
jgi:hypothetical protein